MCVCHVLVVHDVCAPSLVVPFFAEGFFIKTNSKSLNDGPVTSFCPNRTCCCYMKPFRSIVVWAEPCFNVVLIRCAWCILSMPHRSCSRLGKRTWPEVSSDGARRASYQRQHRSMMNQRSRQSQKMSQSSTVSSWTKKNQTLSHRHSWSSHQSSSKKSQCQSPNYQPCFGAPQLVGAGAVHRAQDSVRQGLFLNSAHHTMSRRCSAFQLFACHHKHVSIFLCHHKAGWRMLRASSETASVARDLRVKRKIFPDVCISCFVVLVFDISLADCRSLLPMCVCSVRPLSLECTQLSVWCACQVPQERCMCWKYAPSNKYAACVELDFRPNSLRSLILRYTVSLERGGV